MVITCRTCRATYPHLDAFMGHFQTLHPEGWGCTIVRADAPPMPCPVEGYQATDAADLGEHIMSHGGRA